MKHTMTTNEASYMIQLILELCKMILWTSPLRCLLDVGRAPLPLLQSPQCLLSFTPKVGSSFSGSLNITMPNRSAVKRNTQVELPPCNQTLLSRHFNDSISCISVNDMCCRSELMNRVMFDDDCSILLALTYLCDNRIDSQKHRYVSLQFSPVWLSTPRILMLETCLQPVRRV